jgi:hypothetical protein
MIDDTDDQLRDLIPKTLDLLLAKAMNPSRYSVLLGHVIGVALRLKETKTKQVNNGRVLIEEKRVSQASLAHGLMIGRDCDVLHDPHPGIQSGGTALCFGESVRWCQS